MQEVDSVSRMMAVPDSTGPCSLPCWSKVKPESALLQAEVSCILNRVDYWWQTMGTTAAEVTDIKTSHDQYFAVLRGGTHHNRLPASWGHNHPFQIMATDRWKHSFARPQVRDRRVHIVGELCTPKDRMHSDAEVALRAWEILFCLKSLGLIAGPSRIMIFWGIRTRHSII